MTTARDIMHPGAQCIQEDESLFKAAQMMRDLKVGSLPICGKDDRLHGIVTDRDIVVKCCAEGRNPADVTAGQLGQGTPHWVDANTDVSQVLNMMEQHQIRRLPVIEERRLVGMISEADLAKTVSERELGHFVESVYATS
jgi:CBS domain-containing protein